MNIPYFKNKLLYFEEQGVESMNCKNLLLTFMLTASSMLATENVLQKEEYDFEGLTLGVSLSLFNSTTNEYLYDFDDKK